MNTRRNNDRRRALRLLLPVVLAIAAALSASPASAATTATFAHGVLTVTGDGANNSIVVRRDAAGRILVNNGAIAVVGGTPTVANTALIRVLGQGGTDSISLDESQRRAATGEPVRRRQERRSHRRLRQ